MSALSFSDQAVTTDLGLAELLGLGDPYEFDLGDMWASRPNRDRLRVPIGVSLDGRPVGALYGFRYRQSFCFYQTGFDLLHGDERYKFDWARQVRALERIELYPPSAHGWLGRRMAALPAWGRDSLLAAPRSLAMLYVGDLSLVPDALGPPSNESWVG